MVFVQLPAAFGQARRIVKRVVAAVDESPLPLQLAKAESDAQRINRALANIPALGDRARVAFTVIRTTPLIPPKIGIALARIGAEIRAFRRASS